MELTLLVVVALVVIPAFLVFLTLQGVISKKAKAIKKIEDENLYLNSTILVLENDIVQLTTQLNEKRGGLVRMDEVQKIKAM